VISHRIPAVSARATVVLVLLSAAHAQQLDNIHRSVLSRTGIARRPNQPHSFTPSSDHSLFLAVALFGSGGAGGTRSIAVGDLNGDGKPDLVVTNACPLTNADCSEGAFPTSHGAVAVLLGNGDGTFQPAVTFNSGGDYPSSVALADLNGDSKLDLIVANECSPGECAYSLVSVLMGNGDGTFQPPVNYRSGGFEESDDDVAQSSVAVGEVNGDGKLDLVVENQCAFDISNYCVNGTVGVLLGNGDGSFRPAVVYDSGGEWPYTVALADLNGDGRLDIAVANCGPVGGDGCGSGMVGVLMNNGSGGFQPAVLYPSGGAAATGLFVADVNGDSKPDLLVANYCGAISIYDCEVNGTVGVLLGNGDGTFQPAVAYSTGGYYPVSLTSADINGDGKLDIAAANWGTSDVGVLLGNGDGTFQPAVTNTDRGYLLQAVIAADVNGDGRPDIEVADGCNATCSAGAVSALLNLP
jgi:hypothetical protein